MTLTTSPLPSAGTSASPSGIVFTTSQALSTCMFFNELPFDLIDSYSFWSQRRGLSQIMSQCFHTGTIFCIKRDVYILQGYSRCHTRKKMKKGVPTNAGQSAHVPKSNSASVDWKQDLSIWRWHSLTREALETLAKHDLGKGQLQIDCRQRMKWECQQCSMRYEKDELSWIHYVSSRRLQSSHA